MGIFSKSSSNSRETNTENIKQKNSLLSQFSSDRLADFAHKSPRLVGPQTRPRLMMPIADIPIPPAPDPATNPAAYLRSIYAVRERSRLIFSKVPSNSLDHFDVDLTKFKDTADFVTSIIKVGVIDLCLPSNY